MFTFYNNPKILLNLQETKWLEPSNSNQHGWMFYIAGESKDILCYMRHYKVCLSHMYCAPYRSGTWAVAGLYCTLLWGWWMSLNMLEDITHGWISIWSIRFVPTDYRTKLGKMNIYLPWTTTTVQWDNTRQLQTSQQPCEGNPYLIVKIWSDLGAKELPIPILSQDSI